MVKSNVLPSTSLGNRVTPISPEQRENLPKRGQRTPKAKAETKSRKAKVPSVKVLKVKNPKRFQKRMRSARTRRKVIVIVEGPGQPKAVPKLVKLFLRIHLPTSQWLTPESHPLERLRRKSSVLKMISVGISNQPLPLPVSLGVEEGGRCWRFNFWWGDCEWCG